MVTKLWAQIASALQAKRNCAASGNTEWYDKHEATLDKLAQQLPRGSGFDSGTKLVEDKSMPNALKFYTEFHHMDNNGCYDGWTEHTVIVTPRFDGSVDIKVGGRDRNGIKDYIAECFGCCRTAEETESAAAKAVSGVAG